jgi:hypothetical protein
MGCATFYAIFSQTYQVTLVTTRKYSYSLIARVIFSSLLTTAAPPLIDTDTNVLKFLKNNVHIGRMNTSRQDLTILIQRVYQHTVKSF